MFEHLTNLGYKRNLKQAIGFYLAYVILTLIIAAILGGIIGALFINKSNEKEVIGLLNKMGLVMAVIVTIVIGILILKAKKKLNKFGFVIIVFLSGLLALFTGILGGLIPVAYLSTKTSKNVEKLDSVEKPQKAKKKHDIKSILWKVYFYIFVLLMINGYLLLGLDDTLTKINLVVSLPSLLGFFLYAYKKKFLKAITWKVYTIIFIIFDLLYNLFSYPIDYNMLFGFVIIFPSYVALYLYAFRFLKK